MEVLYPSGCGIDVHKQFLVACLQVVDETGRQHKELRRFSTMTADLLSCVDWLKAAQCRAIAMESTGGYWKSPWNLMEGHFEIVMMVNAQHLKRVPGRKTDKKDAEWLAELLQLGLLKPSFIPSRPQRELRDLTRLRTTLIAERTRLVNRLHKTLEDTNLKLSSVLTDIMGQTGQHILGAILRGEGDPAVLANLALRRAVRKRDALTLALRGRVSDHHRGLLRELLEMIQHHDQAIDRLDQQIAGRLRPYEMLIQRLDGIPGCSRRVIEVLFAEVGWDLSAFPDAAHLASWVGIVRLYANTGAMTPGSTPETVDGMSMAKIEKLIDDLRHERYRWTPVRRTYIAKKNGKLRGLGLPTWSDKLLQEVIRLILEAYYFLQQFSPNSHGFRPGRGCHTALTAIRDDWSGTKWFIEGDISQYFDHAS